MADSPAVNLPNVPNQGNSKKLLILAGIAGGILVVVLVLVFIVTTFFKGAAPVTITYWGLWEPESVYSTVIADYKRKNPRVTVKYVKQSPLNYRERVLSAIAKDGGPDIFRIHNTWLPMFKAGTAPVTKDVFTAQTFKSTFYPVASADLVSGGVPYAIPLEVDTLAMYVNQDVLTAGGVGIPITWDEFRTAAAKLTVRDSSGRIKTAGAAIGAAANVDHWQDVVSLMMLQAGVDMTGAVDSKAAADALAYYTSFVTVDKVWDETLDNSTLAFASGKVGMYFGPSWRYFDFKNINPNLNFKVVPVPQLTGGKTVNLASYWAEAVSKKSPNQAVAFDFLKFISSEEELTKLYTAEVKVRAFGEPYSRTRMATLLTSDPAAAVFVSQAPSAESSYLTSATNDGDTGINSRIAKYYLDAVNAMQKGGDPATALQTVAKGVAQVLQSYGVVSGGQTQR